MLRLEDLRWAVKFDKPPHVIVICAPDDATEATQIAGSHGYELVAVVPNSGERELYFRKRAEVRLAPLRVEVSE